MNRMKNREIGVDIAKVVAMFLVVLLHVSGQVGDEGAFIHSISYCCIDVFALASGYLCLNATWRFVKILRLWLQTVFWGVVVLSACKIGGYEVLLKDVVDAIFPVSRYTYWYFTSYTLLFFVMPLLNVAIKNVSKKTLQQTLLAVFIMVCMTSLIEGDICYFGYGYSFAWLSVLYVAGGYLRLYQPISWKSGTCFIVAFISVSLGFLLGILFDALGFHHPGEKIRLAVSYVSPFTVFEAICIFVGCQHLKIHNDRVAKFWKMLSISTFGVYLIHVQPFFFKKVWPQFLGRALPDSVWKLVPIEIFLALAIYIGCTFLELLRIKLFDFCYNAYSRNK